MIKKISNNVINIFLVALCTITLIRAMTQLAKLQSILSIKKNLIFTLLVILCVSGYIFRRRIEKILNLLSSYYYLYLIIFILIITTLIIYQLNMIQALTGTMDLDPFYIYSLILNGPTDDNFYFSWYPNLLFLLNIENAIYRLLGKPSLYVFLKFLNYINMFLIDSGLILTYFTVKKQINRRYAFLTFLIGILLYGITPYIAIPYSDNWAFWICSLYVFLLSICISKKNNNFSKIVALLSIGIVSALLFKIKPSTAIVLIATMIICILFTLTKIKTLNTTIKKMSKIILLITIPFLITYSTCNYFANNNRLVRIEQNQSASALHFMAMGLHGNGEYWDEFNKKDQALSPSLRKSYEIKTIKNDIKDFKSLIGLSNFVINKQQHNSSLASWQRNTGPVSWSLVPKLKLHNKFQSMLRNIFTKNDFFYWNGYLIFIQAVWVIVIIGMILAYDNDSFFVQINKYTIVGGFIFLILFEGGVSRYMIQYLPFMMILSVFGFFNLKKEK